MGNLIFFVIIIIYALYSVLRKNRVLEHVEKEEERAIGSGDETSPLTVTRESRSRESDRGSLRDLFGELQEVFGDLEQPRDVAVKNYDLTNYDTYDSSYEGTSGDEGVGGVEGIGGDEGVAGSNWTGDSEFAYRSSTHVNAQRKNTTQQHINVGNPREGMKWALIYGPPRAKTSYRSRSNMIR